MTWLNRGFKLRHKFTKEKDMKAEAIQALELFKQQHLARAVDTNGQADIVSESPQPTEEHQMEQRNLGELLSEWEEGEKSKKQKGVNFNYPDHIKPLKDRIMSALNNGCRTAESVATYCKEEVKLVNLQLGRWVSRGLIGRKVSATGITRYYPHDLAKEMGILTAPQPIHRKGKKAKEQKRSSPLPTHQPQPTQAEAFVLRNEAKTSPLAGKDYVSFLEKRIVEWQVECRKLATETNKYKNQIAELEAQVMHAQADVVKAKTEPRNVTGEVAEVMKEVMELRATVSYLESKLFGRK